MIHFSDVEYKFPDGNRALYRVNLSIKKGEKVAVIGANGSGKSTFGLHINGILRPTSGSVRIGALDPTQKADNSRLKQMVGMVFQNPDNQLVTMTVENEIAFSLENLNVDRDEMQNRVDAIMDLFDLENYRNRLTAELSGGEKQKLALASVLVTEPDILVLDEPDSYLDQTGMNILNGAVRMLEDKKPNLTVIRITQYASAADLYDRIILFRDGTILKDGTPDEIFSDSETCRRANIDVPLKYRMKNKVDFPRVSLAYKKLTNDAVNRNCSIKLKTIDFGYDKTSLLENLNLEIMSGKIYGLVGATGSGKSTLIQLMAGLLKPNSGEIEYNNFSKESGSVVISFQHPERQFFLNSVDEEILFGPRNLGNPNAREIADRCYTMVGLDKTLFAVRDPFQLSGGEKRRVSLASILSLEPKFIFFDEPTCGLDFEGVCLLKKAIVDLRNQGAGIIVISHQGDILLELADEILVLADKDITQWDKTDEFFRRNSYLNFLSTPEIISYQKQNLESINYFSESELSNGLDLFGG